MFDVLVYANALIIVATFASFFISLIKYRKSTYFAKMTEYLIYAIAFYLLKGTNGYIYYLLASLNLFLQILSVNKKVIVKIIYSLIIGVVVYIYRDFNFYHLIPLIVLVFQMWIKPYIKFINQSILTFIERIMMAIYAFTYELYLLFLKLIYKASFTFVTYYLKKLVDFTDKKTTKH